MANTNQIVTESWTAVKAAFTLEEVGQIFYKNLFTIAPEVKDTIFANSNHTMQPKKLMSFIDACINMLDKPEKLVPFVVRCGERHGAYGHNGAWCEPEHYSITGKALMATLEQGLGDAFTPELRTAWSVVYGILQDKLIEGQCNEKGQAIRAAAVAKLAANAPVKSTNELVTESWAILKSAFTLEEIGKLFYKNLFTIAPEAEHTVFGSTNHTMQPAKLMSFLDNCVSLLDQPEKLVPVLIKCGERHGAYGHNGAWCEPEHYVLTGKALMVTLEQGLACAFFTADIKTAWAAVYGVIESKLIEGQCNEKGQAIRAAAIAKLAAKRPLGD